jgi:hypothetical protein
MSSYLYAAKVKFKEFKAYVLGTTEEVRQATAQTAEAAGRPVVYLASSATRKEDVAHQIAERDGVKEGLICVLTCVEPCWSYQVRPNAKTHRLELRSELLKCGQRSEAPSGGDANQAPPEPQRDQDVRPAGFGVAGGDDDQRRAGHQGLSSQGRESQGW